MEQKRYILAVDTSKSEIPFAELAKKLDAKGEEMGMSIRLQREDIFEAMHRV